MNNLKMITKCPLCGESVGILVTKIHPPEPEVGIGGPFAEEISIIASNCPHKEALEEGWLEESEYVSSLSYAIQQEVENFWYSGGSFHFNVVDIQK